MWNGEALMLMLSSAPAAACSATSCCRACRCYRYTGTFSHGPPIPGTKQTDLVGYARFMEFATEKTCAANIAVAPSCSATLRQLVAHRPPDWRDGVVAFCVGIPNAMICIGSGVDGGLAWNMLFIKVILYGLRARVRSVA